MMATTLTTAPPIESRKVVGWRRTRDRSRTPRNEAISIPATAVANTTMIASTACTLGSEVTAVEMPGAK